MNEYWVDGYSLRRGWLLTRSDCWREASADEVERLGSGDMDEELALFSSTSKRFLSFLPGEMVRNMLVTG